MKEIAISMAGLLCGIIIILFSGFVVSHDSKLKTFASIRGTIVSHDSKLKTFTTEVEQIDGSLILMNISYNRQTLWTAPSLTLKNDVVENVKNIITENDITGNLSTGEKVAILINKSNTNHIDAILVNKQNSQ